MQVTTILAFFFSLVVQVGFPLSVVLYFRRRTLAHWAPFFMGALVYVIFQLFTWLPLSTYLEAVAGAGLQEGFGAFAWLLAMAFVGSLLEETGRLWGYRVLFSRTGEGLTWPSGVMLGLGHAAVESMLLIGGLTFVHLLAYVALNLLGPEAIITSVTADATPAFREALQAIADTTWAQPVVVAFERIVGLVHQVAWALLVMQSLVSRQKRWFSFSVLYHASVAVIVPGLVRLSGFPLAEAANALLAGLSIWIIVSLKKTAAAPE
ncbi:MAG: YhfC family intramembrane metalloprotease [Chloroflexi bacterium]|nr:YhfC family intramembrane metalloprotease [Chloroflexota bacterium]